MILSDDFSGADDRFMRFAQELYRRSKNENKQASKANTKKSNSNDHQKSKTKSMRQTFRLPAPICLFVNEIMLDCGGGNDAPLIPAQHFSGSALSSSTGYVPTYILNENSRFFNIFNKIFVIFGKNEPIFIEKLIR